MEENEDLELDDELEDDDEESPPTGQKNYITVKGLQKLQGEFAELKNVERPRIVETVAWAASNGDRSENADYIYGKRRLREIDRRLRFLSKKLANAEVVDPTLQKNRDRVFFGATVTVEDEDGEQKTYSIVGADEVDVKNGKISWLSPLGKALLQSQVGDTVFFKTNANEIELQVIKIEYKEIK